MKAKCWLVGAPNQGWSSRLQAASRGWALEVCGYGALSNIPRAAGSLIAVDFDGLRRLTPSARTSLSEQIKEGATCYLGGGLPVGAQYSLEPLASVDFRVGLEHESPGYMLTAQPLLPAAMRGESVGGRYNIPVARGLSGLAQPLAVARACDGPATPSLFAIEHGRGVIICDLAGCGQTADTSKSARLSLLRSLENETTRLEIIGPLVAFDNAAGRDQARPAGCNIVIDDRPANLDYFNIKALRYFFGYLAQRCPQVHVDFAWTPDQRRPSRHYVETLKQFNAGFVWHGLLHHCDHRTIANPELDFARGRRLVKDICERYQVRFQPVMVFPYEKDTNDCVALLKREGFIAKAETPVDVTTVAAAPTETVVTRQPECVGDDVSDGFTILTRDSIETLNRNRMLARAALGMPIIAAAHPRNAGLRRFVKTRRDCEALADFDDVLDFMATKKLRFESLEELAVEALAAGANPA